MKQSNSDMNASTCPDCGHPHDVLVAQCQACMKELVELHADDPNAPSIEEYSMIRVQIVCHDNEVSIELGCVRHNVGIFRLKLDDEDFRNSIVADALQKAIGAARQPAVKPPSRTPFNPGLN